MPTPEEKYRNDPLQKMFAELLQKVEVIIEKYPLPKLNASKEHIEAVTYFKNLKEYLSLSNKLYQHLVKKNNLKAKYNLYKLSELAKKFPAEKILNFTFSHVMKYEFFEFVFELMQSVPKELPAILAPTFDPAVIFLDEKEYKIKHRKNPDGTPSYLYDCAFLNEKKVLEKQVYDLAEMYTHELPQFLTMIAAEKERFLAKKSEAPLSEAELLARCGKFATDSPKQPIVTPVTTPSKAPSPSKCEQN